MRLWRQYLAVMFRPLRRDATLKQAIVVVGLIGAAVVLILVVVKWAPHWLASTKGLAPKDRADEYGRVRTALLALLAGGVAVVGAYYTSRTFALSRQGQITERFTRAVDQLGNTEPDVRLGGIYGLERLARESSDDHGPIVEILTAYVREHAASRADGRRLTEKGLVVKPRTDVQAVLTVLGRRRREYDGHLRLELQATGLRGAILEGAHLERTNLDGAHLQDANFDEAHLEGALLRNADLEDATFVQAHLEGAHLSKANLKYADFQGARLDGADLGDADLSGADLDGAHLGDADLSGAHLEGAALSGAHLEGVELSTPDGGPAIYDSSTQWPDGFDPASRGAEEA